MVAVPIRERRRWKRRLVSWSSTVLDVQGGELQSFVEELAVAPGSTWFLAARDCPYRERGGEKKKKHSGEREERRCVRLYLVICRGQPGAQFVIKLVEGRDVAYE